MAGPTLKLNTGAQMPQVGYGLWKVENNVCADMVYNAIKEGYRLFDGACDYGNEVESGQGVARAIKEGIVKREDLFITSKLWNSFHDKEQVEPIVKKQLADWGLDYFDLYLIHFPVAIKYVKPEVRYPPSWTDEDGNFTRGTATLQETWQGLEDIHKAGLAKAIGVSNYSGALLLDLFTYAKTKPAVLQIEHHPYLVQQDLVNLCQSEGIVVTAYSSFGPQSFRDLDMQLGHDTPLLFDHDVVSSVAKKHSKTTAQVLLRWATQRGLAVIPKSSSQTRLQQNLDVTSFDLSDEELKSISALDQRLKFNNPINYGLPFPCFA